MSLPFSSYTSQCRCHRNQITKGFQSYPFWHKSTLPFSSSEGHNYNFVLWEMSAFCSNPLFNRFLMHVAGNCSLSNHTRVTNKPVLMRYSA